MQHLFRLPYFIQNRSSRTSTVVTEKEYTTQQVEQSPEYPNDPSKNNIISQILAKIDTHVDDVSTPARMMLSNVSFL